ncbi:MAG: hypothetical protein NTZ78_02190 [Candidatus Aureabacteria bacterium]|nr:hypothetical protein [Candidatus Auribacterota bacterium]
MSLAYNNRLLTRIALFSGVAVFVALQIIMLLGSLKIYALNDVEELFAGNLAIDIVSGGPLLPIRDYMLDPLHGGLFLLSLCAIPVFYIIGTSYTCLKLTAIIWPITTFVLLYFLLKLYVDRKAAYIACLLYLLPSANTIYYYSWATITHEYIFTFSVAMLLAFWKTESSRKGSYKRVWILILGFIIGFSLFVWPSNCIAGGMIFSLCLLSRKQQPAIGTWVRASLLIMGIALASIPALLQSHAILKIFSPSSLSMESHYNVIKSVYILLTESLPASYAPWQNNGIAWQWSIYLIGVVAYIWAWGMLLSKRRHYNRMLLLFITCYPLIYISIFVHCALVKTSGNSPILQARYLSPLISSLLLAKALMIHWAVTSRYGVLKMGGILILAVLIVFGIFSFCTVLTPVDIGYGTREPGYFAQETGCRIMESCYDNEQQLKVKLEKLSKIPYKVERNDIVRGAAWLMYLYKVTDSEFQVIHPDKFSACMETLKRCVPRELQSIFREELGAFVFWHSKYDFKSSIDNLTKGLSREDAELSFVGLARVLPAWTKDPLKLKEAINTIPYSDKKALFYAMGQYFATGPDQGASISAIADGIGDKEIFLAGCKDPYGTRMYYSPVLCH